MMRGAGDWGEVAAGRRWALWLGALVAAAGLAGCGGGGGSGGSAPSGGSSSTGTGGSSSTGTGAIRVLVSDFFGKPVAGASVWVSSSNATLVTNLSGVAQFDRVPVGTTRVCARHPVMGHTCIAPDPVMVEKDQVLQLSGRLEPRTGPAAAVLHARVDPDGIAEDGRTLDLTIRVAVPADVRRGSYFGTDSDGSYELATVDCSARVGDELAQLGPRCLWAADGRDVSYAFGRINDRGVLKPTDRESRPKAVGLLIEQSDTGLSSEWTPNEPRLYAARMFAFGLLPDSRLLLAGFASDEPSGRAANLPQRPVTFFPVESPAFTASLSGAFTVLDDLSSLVGGGTPLYEAIAASVDFMAANAPDGAQRVLVVLADGVDSTCGTPARCVEWRRQIVARARESAVELFLVGARGDAPAELEEKYLSQGFYLAKEPLSDLALEGGFPLAVGVSFRGDAFAFEETADFDSPLELVRDWLSTSEQVQDVRIRLTSDVAGAFAPGAVIKGQLLGQNPDECPWYCYTYVLPFTVEIPR